VVPETRLRYQASLSGRRDAQRGPRKPSILRTSAFFSRELQDRTSAMSRCRSRADRSRRASQQTIASAVRTRVRSPTSTAIALPRTQSSRRDSFERSPSRGSCHPARPSEARIWTLPAFVRVWSTRHLSDLTVVMSANGAGHWNGPRMTILSRSSTIAMLSASESSGPHAENREAIAPGFLPPPTSNRACDLPALWLRAAHQTL
jgi:hypothetical protein